MYNEKMICIIKVNNKELKENEDKVYLPYGCEYSIHFKNLNTQRAVINVEIDSEDILKGKSLIIEANGELTLERFLENLDEGRKFRFIEKTKEISNFRGDKAEDGLLKITYKYEKKIEKIYPQGFQIRSIEPLSFGSYGDMAINNSVNDKPQINSTDLNIQTNNLDKGITVEGSKSTQQFKKGYIGELERNEHIMIFQLFGYQSINGIEPEQETLIKEYKQCPSCGEKYYENEEYCSKDGTYLKEFSQRNYLMEELEKLLKRRTKYVQK